MQPPLHCQERTTLGSAEVMAQSALGEYGFGKHRAQEMSRKDGGGVGSLCNHRRYLRGDSEERCESGKSRKCALKPSRPRKTEARCDSHVFSSSCSSHLYGANIATALSRNILLHPSICSQTLNNETLILSRPASERTRASKTAGNDSYP